MDKERKEALERIREGFEQTKQTDKDHTKKREKIDEINTAYEYRDVAKLNSINWDDE